MRGRCAPGQSGAPGALATGEKMYKIDKFRRIVSLSVLIFVSITHLAAAPGLDLAFGNQGVVITDFFDNKDFANGIAIVRNSRIFLVGTTWGGNSNWDFAVAGYNFKGAPLKFGTKGKIVTQMGAGSDIAYAVAAHGNTFIVVAGGSHVGSNRVMSVARYKLNGALDAGFGTAGKVMIPVGFGKAEVAAIAIQKDGKILLAGYSSGSTRDFAVVRLNANGVLDNTFGTAGVVTTNFGTSDDFGNAIVIQSDQKILVAGTSIENGSQVRYSTARYMPNGSLDANFGTGGTVTTKIGDGSGVTVRSIGIQSTGNIVVGGAGTAKAFTLVRYTSAGKLDTTFGTQGIATTLVSGGVSPYSMAVRPDDKIIGAGFPASSLTGFGVTGYKSTGVALESFGTNGPIGTFGDRAQAIVLQTDGKVLVAGSANFGGPGTSEDFALVRYLNNW